MQDSQDSTQNEDPFLDAIERNDEDAVKIFLEDITFNPGVDDNKAFQLAAEKGHINILNLMLNDERVDPAANKKNAIVLANKNKNIEVLNLLVYNKRANPNPSDSFLWAVSFGHVELVRLLLVHPMVDLRIYGVKAISLVANNSDSQILRLLLSDEKVNPQPNYIFSQALTKKDDAVISILLSDPRLNLEKAILSAAESADDKVLLLLLAKVRRSFKPSSLHDSNIMKNAAYLGHYFIVEALLSDGTVHPRGAIEAAAEGRHPGIVQLLLSDKRVATCKNMDKCVFDFLIQENDDQHLKILLENGCTFKDSKNKKFSDSEMKHQALRDVCRNKNTKIVKILLEHGGISLKLKKALFLEACRSKDLIILKAFSESECDDIGLVIDDGIKYVFNDKQNEYDQVISILLANPKINFKNAIVLVAGSANDIALKWLLAKNRHAYALSSLDHSHIIKNAAYLGHYEIVEALLRDGRVHPYGAIEFAVKGKHYGIVQLLLSDRRVSTCKNMNKCVFDYLIKKNGSQLLKLLLSNGCVFTDDGNKKFSDSEMKNQALRNACDNKNTDIVKIFLQHGHIHIELIKIIFLTACKRNDIEIINVFIESMCDDKGCVSTDGILRDGIQYAFDHNRTEVVKCFLEKLPFSESFLNEKFQYACQHDCDGVVKLLLEHQRPKPATDDILSKLSRLVWHSKSEENTETYFPVDPTSNDNIGILYASLHRSTKVLVLLVKDPRISAEVKDEAMRISAQECIDEAKKGHVAAEKGDVADEKEHVAAKVGHAKTFAVSACHKIGFFDSTNVNIPLQEEIPEDIFKCIRDLTIAVTIQPK